MKLLPFHWPDWWSTGASPAREAACLLPRVPSFLELVREFQHMAHALDIGRRRRFRIMKVDARGAVDDRVDPATKPLCVARREAAVALLDVAAQDLQAAAGRDDPTDASLRLRLVAAPDYADHALACIEQPPQQLRAERARGTGEKDGSGHASNFPDSGAGESNARPPPIS